MKTLGVEGYPTLLFYRNGELDVIYEGEYTTEYDLDSILTTADVVICFIKRSIVNFIRTRTEETVRSAASISDVQDILSKVRSTPFYSPNAVCVVGVSLCNGNCEVNNAASIFF